MLSLGCVERREVLPRRYPVQVRAPVEETLRALLTAAVAGAPERTGDLLIGGRGVGEVRLYPVQESEGCGVAEGGLGAALKEPKRRAPLFESDSLQLERLLRFDPRRIVICATALVGAEEVFVGIGAIELVRGAEPEPVLADEHLTDGLGELLAAALSGRADAITRFRAA